MLRKSWLLLALASVSAMAAAQDVYGLKSNALAGGPPSSPPTMLYTFPFGAGAFVTLGPVTVGGNPTDADALAQNDLGHLFAFQLHAGSSTLIEINPATQVGTPRGFTFGGIEMRGACFDAAGRLWALDATHSAIVQVNPATGGPMGPAAPLTLGGLPFAVSNACDLATYQGGVLLERGNQFYKVNLFTGALAPEFADGVMAPDGSAVLNVGLAMQGRVAFTFDANAQDDVFQYATGAWIRALKYGNVIPAMNSGRGDLASRPRRVPIRGLVRLGQWEPGEQGVPALIEVMDPIAFVYEQHPVILGPGGAYEVWTSLEGGFQVFAKSPHWLRRGRPQAIGPDGADHVDFFLPNGDVNGDNEVGPEDFGRLSHSFGTWAGHPRYDRNADLDGNEEVGPSDFAILSAHFGQEGD